MSSMKKYGGGQFSRGAAKKSKYRSSVPLVKRMIRKYRERIEVKRKPEMQSSTTFVHAIHKNWFDSRRRSACCRRRTTTLQKFQRGSQNPNRQSHTSSLPRTTAWARTKIIDHLRRSGSR